MNQRFDNQTVIVTGGVAIKGLSVNRADLYMRDSGAGITHDLPQALSTSTAKRRQNG